MGGLLSRPLSYRSPTLVYGIYHIHFTRGRGMSLAQSYEVIVIGGGAAGTAAAIGAASAGAATLLVESAPFLGGAATLKSVLTYCGLFTNHQQKQAVFGVADQVLQRLGEMGAVSEPIQFHGVAVLIEPESVKYVLEDRKT